MIHYSCDRCGCSLGKDRFEVKIEVTPVFDPEEITEEELNADHLQKIAEEIEALQSTGDFELEETGSKFLNMDFCSRCAKQFLNSPVQVASSSRVTFSNN